ncbi:MAG TPA: zinc metallopeptidase [Phycisphaerales bacterium]|nr:zinc metallopeptidase [Phycisphaerales bacterium]
MIFDPMYFVFLAPAMLLALWAQFRVQSAYAQMSRVPARSGVTGAQAAAAMLRRAGLTGVAIAPGRGVLSDHYDPRSKTLRLSPQVYGGTSLASLGIAAHEAGHALQDARGYAPLRLRNGIVPLAAVGSRLAVLLIIMGIVLGAGLRAGGLGGVLLWGGIGLFSTVVAFQLVNLPVEYDASARARLQLQELGLVDPDEVPMVRRVLSAAALTYVAATLTAILTLAYYVTLALGSSRRE